MWPAFLTTILFSISAISGNRTARLLGGTEANFWRLTFATVLLAFYAHLFGGGLAGAALPIFLLSGSIGFGLGDVALFQALPRLGSRLSMIFVACLSAPIAAAIEWLWLGSTMSLAEMGSATVILSGVALALAPDRRTELPAAGKTTGTMFGLASAVCQAVGAVLSRRAFMEARLMGDDIDGITAAYQRIVGGLIVTALCLLIVKRAGVLNLFRGSELPDPRRPPGVWQRAWPLVLVNGLAGPTLGVSCYQWSLKNEPTGIVLPIVAITPLVIIPFSRYLEGERPSARSIIGGVIAVLGAVGLAVATHW